ncbi:MAG TPA: hypothetical protein VLX44_07060 [Xanthobacteraceae bacterium]|nr:hypothetical protein [Xanthobacteraceae bacterium]
MQFVFRIGPLPGDAANSAYFVHPGRSGKEVFFASSDHAALARIADIYVGEPICVEPDLVEPGASLGIPPAPITPDRAHIMGLLALDIASPGLFRSVKTAALLHEFIDACAALWRAAPWQWNYARSPLRVEMEGFRSNVCDAVILGWQSEPCGLALFPQAGMVERLEIATLHDLANSFSNLSTLGVTFEREPLFAADAMRRSCGMRRFPSVVHLDNGQTDALVDGDMAELVAALRAIEVLTDAGADSLGHVSVGDLAVQALAIPRRGG